MEEKPPVHELKTAPKAFTAIIQGIKRFEYRKNDRDYTVGDHLLLKEYDYHQYTGREVEVLVTYILYSPAFGVAPGYCVMSLILLLPSN